LNGTEGSIEMNQLRILSRDCLTMMIDKSPNKNETLQALIRRMKTSVADGNIQFLNEFSHIIISNFQIESLFEVYSTSIRSLTDFEILKPVLVSFRTLSNYKISSTTISQWFEFLVSFAFRNIEEHARLICKSMGIMSMIE
jgi:hypothetical protein